MKKVLFGLVVLAVVVLGCGCDVESNRDIGFDTTYKFTWAIVELGNGKVIEGEVTSWRDFTQSDTVQFTINGVTYLTHYSKVILLTKRP